MDRGIPTPYNNKRGTPQSLPSEPSLIGMDKHSINYNLCSADSLVGNSTCKMRYLLRNTLWLSC